MYRYMFRPHLVLLVFLCQLLECPADSPIRVKVFSNRSVRSQRATDRVRCATYRAVLGERAADGAIFAEDRGAVARFFDAGCDLKIIRQGW